MVKNLCQITTVHNRSDTRIRLKQTASLAQQTNAKVFLLVQDGLCSEKEKFSSVEVINTGPKSGNRLIRMTLGALRMLRAVRRARPDVAHFHDPELIPVGLVLKLGGCRVIYDVHEDVPKQILGKYYLPLLVRKPVAWAMESVERIAGRCFDAIVPATPRIAEQFPGEKAVVVQNFPILGELVAPDPIAYDMRPPCFAYVGGITSARGVREMVKAIGRMPCREARLRLAGAFYPEGLLSKIKTLPGWGKVDFLGWADRQQVAKLLGSVRAGLVLFHPAPNHCSAQPNKMFEYMAAGLPVIASDFPLWREIVDGAGCGLLVDPMDPDAIAKAMQWILAHPADAEAMGRRGRQAVVNIYNWEREAKKLIKLYERLLNQDLLIERKKNMRIATIVGARPQFIKAATVSRAIAGNSSAISETIIHTGQHFDAGMSDIFFEELGIPEPNHHLGVSGGGHGAMTGAMLAKLEPLLQEIRPDWVLVYGDTNSTLAGALVAAKLHLPVAHVEAGLRSYNRRMPEEINRIVTDQLSTVLFCPTVMAIHNLEAEGFPLRIGPDAKQEIVNSGDVMFDAALFYAKRAEGRSAILTVNGLKAKGYVLATVHRAENTDDPLRLRAIMEGLEATADQIPVVLPLHPRTRAAMEREGIRVQKIKLIDPVGYLDMVVLEVNASVIATDSGGVQKEAYFHGVPCVTLRDETEWTELVDAEWNRLAPPSQGDPQSVIIEAIGRCGKNVRLYGDGQAGKVIINTMYLSI